MKKKGKNDEDCHVHFFSTIDERWLSLEPVYLGIIPSGLGTPDVYCCVECHSQPILRLNLYGDTYVSPFQDGRVWQNWVVVGFAWQVHFVSLKKRERTFSYSLEGYFGSLYTTQNIVVVASATALWGFDREGQLLWQSEDLAMDGVLVTSIEGDRIGGRGQIDWEPPDGVWVPFSLSLSSGKRI